jgi:hypothetical protein
MSIRSIDPATYEPLYTCEHCSIPTVPGDKGTYTKDHKYFCSPGCLYIYYEGEPATQGEDYEL